MPWIDAFAPAEARYRSDVMAATWGHLAMRKRQSYSGYFIFAIPEYDSGTPCLVASEFKRLNDSPWLYDAMWDFAGQTEKAGVYRFDGTVCNYEFKGTVTRINTDADAATAARKKAK